MEENSTDLEYREINFRDYWRILLKRRWLVIGFFLAVVTVTLLRSLTSTPIYQAQCQIMIERSNPNILSPQEVFASDYTSAEFYQTQYKILESRALARAVVRRLNLTAHPEFVSKETLKEKSLEVNVPGQGSGNNADKALEDGVVGAVLGGLQVDPIRNSHLVNVGFESTNPVLAARIANAAAAAYIDWNLGLRIQSQKDSANFLDDQVKEQKQKLEASEQALQQYREKFGVAAINPRGAGRETETMASQKMMQVTSQLVEAQQRRIEAETRYHKAQELLKNPEQAESIPDVVSNPLIIQIKNQEVDLLRKKAELAEKFGPKHPTMTALNQEIENLNRKKVQEVRNIVSSLKTQYDIAVSQEQSLRSAASRSRAESLDQNKVAIQYQVLQQEVESNRALYDMLLKRLKETNVSEENKMISIHVVDQAEVPKSPSKPRTARNLMLAMVIGLMGGVGLAFFFEYLDNTIKTPDDVERHFNLPYLGPIPDFEIKEDDPTRDLIVLHSPKSSASESFRGLRTSILFASARKVPRVILITSGAAKEGKTLVAGNLAVTMAQGGGRTLLLDCDMRRPRLHRVFNVQREPGMSNILVGESGWEKMIRETGVENLHLIPSGPIPPNPAELVSSDLMEELLAGLRDRYDRIIIDSPPITAVTDAVALSRPSLVDGLVLVVKVGETSRDITINSIRQLRDMKAHILGVVLNDIYFTRDQYYHYQYYYYYGDDQETPPKTKRVKKSRSRKEPEVTVS
ncbi:MAG: polysaccharide biosynthesis tyrosine autokinase [Thermodesulfobacteriota bacterium]